MGEKLLRRYEITIPQTTIAQLRKSDFQWTFTIFEDLVEESRAQYTSMELYKRFHQIEVNDILYECIIFDFVLGKLIIETNETEKHKVLNILKYFTIHSSSTSQAYFINSKKGDGVI